MNKNLQHTLQQFAPISLTEMNGVSLMKRTDTKFVLPVSQLIPFLDSVCDVYQVLTIAGRSLMSYSSLYFDTAADDFYFDHHNGRSNRTKVRIRNYVESDLFFLEIKQKNGKGVTDKTRIPLQGFETELSTSSRAFIQKVTSVDYDLKPSLSNAFQRITLASMEHNERVTIDLGLSFSKQNTTNNSLEQVMVVELKQSQINRNSPAFQSLRSLGHLPFRISKYCIGMISLNTDLKRNAFKVKLKRISKLLAA